MIITKSVSRFARNLVDCITWVRALQEHNPPIAVYFEQEGIKSKMILQVHDELNFDVIPGELEKVREIVITEMENAYHGRVRLTASHGTAANWLDAH